MATQSAGVHVCSRSKCISANHKEIDFCGCGLQLTIYYKMLTMLTELLGLPSTQYWLLLCMFSVTDLFYFNPLRAVTHYSESRTLTICAVFLINVRSWSTTSILDTLDRWLEIVFDIYQREVLLHLYNSLCQFHLICKPFCFYLVLHPAPKALDSSPKMVCDQLSWWWVLYHSSRWATWLLVRRKTVGGKDFENTSYRDTVWCMMKCWCWWIIIYCLTMLLKFKKQKWQASLQVRSCKVWSSLFQIASTASSSWAMVNRLMVPHSSDDTPDCG